MELAKLDYNILLFISKFDEVTEADILKKFPDATFATIHRLDSLAVSDYINYYACGSENPCMNNAASCKIIDSGRKALQDYSEAEKNRNIQKMEERAWKAIPIIISVIALIFSGFALAKSYGWT